MAKKTYRPGRNLVIFFLGVGVLYGLVALGGTWKPELGLDLQGGTRITLIAKDNPSKANLNEARKIIDKRVNASGVAEAEVVVQGSKFIVVEIPGKTKRDLVDVVKRQAQLRFRLVAKGPQDLLQQQIQTETQAPTSKPTSTGKPKSGATATNRPRPVPGLAPQAPTPSPTPPAPTATPTGTPAPAAEITCPLAAPVNDPVTGLPSTKCDTLDQTMKFAQTPSAAWVTKFNSFTCPAPGTAPVVDNPSEPLLTCDANGLPYLLSKAIIEGTGLKNAGAEVPDKQVNWVVTLDLKDDDKFTKAYPPADYVNPTEVFSKISTAYAGTGRQFAMVLDGTILSAPTMEAAITDGNSQISGDFTEKTARNLATSLKFGALPVAFEDDPSTENIGPSLAGEQLNTGLMAGALGLLAVMIYCLFYYRGLGLVVLASLAIAAGVTFGAVLLLSKTAGFTLTLPGIAGLIIGVGVTADSFVIFFERIRDEMREGRSMRVAVETGWKRARQTRMAANVVSLLSAGVLYLFASGVVKGFGFALGLSTAVDLAVLFWFTKPAVSWLAKFKFFNGGGRMSGLSAETLGMDTVGSSAGGKA